MSGQDVDPEDRITADDLLAGSEHLQRREHLHGLVDTAIDAELASGRREVSVEQVKRRLLVRLAIMVGGSMLVITGLVLMVLPGPGMLVLGIGLGVLSTEVPFAARLLERVRHRLPQDADGKLPKSAIVTMVVMTVLATSASLYWTLSR